MRVIQLQSRPTLAYPDIQVVQRGGFQAHKHLTGTRLRGWEVTVLKDIDISVLVKEDGFQGFTLLEF
jgi:hypothetical protein